MILKVERREEEGTMEVERREKEETIKVERRDEKGIRQAGKSKDVGSSSRYLKVHTIENFLTPFLEFALFLCQLCQNIKILQKKL